MASTFTINEAVKSVLTELEISRKKIVAAKIKGWGAIILGIILLVVGSNLAGIVIGLILLLCLVIPGGVILFKIANETVNYKMRFKKDVVGASLSAIDQSLTFEPYKGILESEFIFSQLFSTDPDRYHTEDLVCGKAGRTSFYFAEVHAEYKTETQTKNGRQVSWHEILKGIIFVADFNKHFNGTTVVRPKDITSRVGAWFSKNVYTFGNRNVVELENEAFNKNFIVNSTDQVEARYILTPAMMERINNLNDRSSYTVSLSFIDSRMYIAFPLAKNYFEAPMFKTLLEPNLLDDDMSVLSFMNDIVRELDLNTRIWTKA